LKTCAEVEGQNAKLEVLGVATIGMQGHLKDVLKAM